MAHPSRRHALLLGLLAITGTAVAAQQLPKPPAFSSGTEVVVVDFFVTDKTDHPVRGLTAKDFVVKEDGKERPIVAFEAFPSDGDSAIAGASANPSTPPNSARASASTVLLVDDGQMSPQQAIRLRPALKALLARVGDRSGSLMLLAPASKVQASEVLPAGAPKVAAVVDRINGQRVDTHSNIPMDDAESIAIAEGDVPVLARVTARFVQLNPEVQRDMAENLVHDQARMVAHEARTRRETMYRVAMVALDWLGAHPGRHSLIIVSGGFARDPSDPKYGDVVTRSLQVNAPIHFLDALGLEGFGPYDGAENGPALTREAKERPTARFDAAEGSTGLADDTGGVIVENANDLAKGLARLLDTMQTYYVIAYQPPPHEKPGFKKIKVEVRTKGLNVRARQGYFDTSKPAAK